MKPTHYILIAVAASLIAFDIVVACTGWLPTISEVAWQTAGQHPVVPFLAGVVAGHLWWQK